MTGNPEFRRNLWLELTPLRLLGMPLTLVAMFFLAWLMDDHQFGNGVKGLALSLFIALTFLWGVRQSAESVLGEIRERTWDWQRMSSISPWSLGWGKLLGSTIYPWYGGAICLFFYLLAADLKPDGVPAAKVVILLVLSGLLMQALALLASLQSIIRSRSLSRSQSSAIMLLGFFAISPVSALMMQMKNVSWYGVEIVQIDFALVSILLFLGWALLGVHNQLRAEFKIRSLPLAWSGFVLFLMVYLAGFAGTDAKHPALSLYLAIALGVATTLTYLILFLERKDPVAARCLVDTFKGRNWRRFAEGMPCWLVTVPFVLITAVLLLCVPENLMDGATPFAQRAILISMVALLTRDIGLVLFLNLSRRPQRADLFAILLFALFYGLLPVILHTMDAKGAAALFWPLHDRWWISLPSAVIQAALMLWLVARRWQVAIQKAEAAGQEKAEG